METFFQGHIDGLLVTASWVERLRHELGLKGVHQVWGEVPAWYLWLAASPGVHCLQMVDVSQLEEGPISSMFAVKFYPALEGPFFPSLSREERDIRQSDLFDESGAPAFDTRHDIPSHMFTVGVLALTMDPDRDWGFYTLTALNARGPVESSGIKNEADSLAGLPGWDLSYPLYHRLLSLHAFHKKQTPVRAQFSVEPGFEGVHASGIDGETLTLSVLFAPDPADPPSRALAMMRRELAEAGVQKVAEQNFSCRHFSGWKIAVSDQPVLSRDWWRLAAVDYRSKLASACGCC